MRESAVREEIRVAYLHQLQAKRVEAWELAASSASFKGKAGENRQNSVIFAFFWPMEKITPNGSKWGLANVTPTRDPKQ